MTSATVVKLFNDDDIRNHIKENITEAERLEIKKEVISELKLEEKNRLKKKRKERNWARKQELSNQSGIKSLYNILVRSLKRINRNPSVVVISTGCFVWVVGYIISLDPIPLADVLFTSNSLSTLLTSVAAIVIVGGVFGFIINSDQFEKAHQNNMFMVINHPDVIIDKKRLERAWLDLTKSRIKKLLPKTYHHAAELINSQFFKADEKYQFDGYESSYDIQIQPETQSAIITVTTKATIVFCPDNTDFEIEQQLTGQCDYTLLRYKIGTETVYRNGSESEDFSFVDIMQDGYEKGLVIKLKKYEALFDQDKYTGIKSICTEKVIQYKQNLDKDPVIAATLKRFIKGNLTIRVKLNKDSGYKVHFTKSGSVVEESHSDMDGEYERFELIAGGNQTLALPGQSYAILVYKTVTK